MADKPAVGSCCPTPLRSARNCWGRGGCTTEECSRDLLLGGTRVDDGTGTETASACTVRRNGRAARRLEHPHVVRIRVRAHGQTVLVSQTRFIRAQRVVVHQAAFHPLHGAVAVGACALVEHFPSLLQQIVLLLDFALKQRHDVIVKLLRTVNHSLMLISHLLKV